MCIQGIITYRIRCAIKSVNHFGKSMVLYICVFNFIGVVAFAVLFLSHGSLYWQLLQLIIWTSHGCFLFYILRRDAMMKIQDAHFKSFGLLCEDYPMYNYVMDDSLFGDLYEKLLLYFKTEKPFLKSGVKVADVASRLSSNKTYVSRLLNDKLNLNFTQFVNAYRIKEAQRLVAEEGRIALPELCKRVGFTSMASFTVAFRLNTGMTPGEWCKKQKLLP
jgi:AraC-like DNA-binding protein